MQRDETSGRDLIGMNMQHDNAALSARGEQEGWARAFGNGGFGEGRWDDCLKRSFGSLFGLSVGLVECCRR